MYQLNYHSKAINGLNLKDLENILETAVTTNATKQITGCLIYHDDSFVQILEGRKEDVLEVYENIKSDPRHHTLIILSQNEVKVRFFEDWNMAYYKPSHDYLQLFVDNLLMLSQLSEKSSTALTNFWDTVGTILRGNPTTQLEPI
ncbi:MAG: BLUF domain-containing protein [Aquaticitalea sp.]